MKRSALVLALVCSAAAFGELSCAPSASRAELPREFARHVVLVSLGRARADHLALEGYPRNTTGHREGAFQRSGELDHTLDVLQRQGTYFASAYVPEGTFEGGMAAWLRGACLRGGRLVESDRSLAEVLRDQGWRTSALISGLPIAEESPLLEGFESVRQVAAPHDLVSRVDEEAGAVGARGLFLWVHLDLPGGATDLLRGDLEKYLDELLHESDRAPVMRDWAAQEARFAEARPYDASEQRTLAALYDARLLYLHDCLRAVLWSLSARRAILPDALLAVVGDRGCELGRREAYVGSRLSAREGALRVPLLLRGGRVPAGAFRCDLVEAADFLPTALRAVNVAAPARVFGSDLWASREGSRRIEGRSADGARTLRDARHRLILPAPSTETAFHREIELYDLEAALGEGVSCAAVKPAVVAELRAFLDA